MEYIIEEGNHYANDIHSGQVSQKFKLTFDEACWYKPFDAENDYNKVFGWSYGILPKRINDELKPAHHYNSIRVAWRPNVEKEGYIGVNIYVYDAGVLRVSNTELFLKTNKEYKGRLYYVLSDGCNSGRIYLDIQSVGIISLDYNAEPIEGYVLNPYFGGNNPAPNKIIINLTKIS